jgi:AcrR family transcriptional regulator
MVHAVSRRPKYDHGKILDAALAVLAKDGARELSVAAVARHLGAPSGSIYHRFASRDLLLATLWLRTVERFQTGFLAALARPRVRLAAEEASLYVLRWCREQPTEARLLMLYHRDDLMGSEWPVAISKRAHHANEALVDGLRGFTARLGKPSDLHLVRFAIIAIPYGAVRDYLARGVPIPKDLDGAVARAVRAALFVQR